MNNSKSIINSFGKKNILVIGDVILDRYIKGTVSRISPEAPVPVVLEEESFFTPGGAANVAHNLSCLGAKVTQVGRIGNDFEGQMLKRLLKKTGINIVNVHIDKSAPTVTKTRVLAQHQQVVRIDREKEKSSLGKEVYRKITVFIKKNIDDFDAVIVSDYGKGLITRELVNFVRNLALEKLSCCV